MKRWAKRSWRRLAFAGAAGAGIGCALAWAANWFAFISGNLRGPDFFSFYAAAQIYVQRGGSAVYDILLSRSSTSWPITHDSPIDPSSCLTSILLDHTLLIAPFANLDYRNAYYAMSALNVVLVIALIRRPRCGAASGFTAKRRSAASSPIAGFLPLFVPFSRDSRGRGAGPPGRRLHRLGRARPGRAGIFSALALPSRNCRC